MDAPVILLTGIGLEGTNLLSGPEGARIAERYRSAEMVSYENRNSKAWQMLVQGLVGLLPLFGDKALGLTSLTTELHELTNGRIGTLNSILSRTALDLIDADDPEHEIITRGMAKAKAAEIDEENRFRSATRRAEDHAR